MDLEKYLDIYDISDGDFSEAMTGYSETEFEDAESVRVLKTLAARFYTARRIFLCCLLALDAHGGQPDFYRWSTAVEEIQGTGAVTRDGEDRLRRILREEESRFRFLKRRLEVATDHSQISPFLQPRSFPQRQVASGGGRSYASLIRCRRVSVDCRQNCMYFAKSQIEISTSQKMSRSWERI